MDDVMPLLIVLLVIAILILSALVYKLKKRINRSTKNFETMFHALPIPVFVLNKETELIYCNRAFSLLTGVRIEPGPRIKHADFDVMIDTDERDQLIERDIALIQEGGEIESTVYIEGQNGQRYTGIYKRVVALHERANPKLIGAFTDISALKEKENKLKKHSQEFRNLVEFAPDIMLLVDQDMIITGMNQQGEITSGFTEEEMLGKPISRILPEYSPSATVTDKLDNTFEIVEMLAEEEEEAQQVMLTKNHKEILVEVSSSPVSFFDEEVNMLSIRDVTGRIERDTALLNAKLEANLAQQSKSNFLANISHEIRTPMNAILGFSSLAKEVATDPQLIQFLQKIDSSTNTLLQIINDILDLSKIEARNFEIDTLPFNLEEDVIEKVIRQNINNAESKQLELLCRSDIGIPAELMGDKYRVEQILTNLLSNAVKFTEKGTINLDLTVTERNDHSVTLLFEVSDTGIGISSQKSDNLFHTFEQGDASATRRFGGTGLGLAICKQLVELMEGKIGVSSTLGKGSTFWFQLSFQLGETKQEIINNVLENSDKRVLILEKSAKSAAILKRYVESLDVGEVIAISNVENAKQLLFSDTKPFDLAFIDCTLQHYSNFALINLLTEIRQQSTTQVVGIVTRGQIAGTKEQDWSALLTTTIERPITKLRVIKATENILTAPSESSKIQDYLHKEQYDFSNVSLLLVEDNPTNQDLAVAVFNRLGVQVTVTNNGKEAFECITDKSKTFDIVFMDIQMPIVDGIKATKLIRSIEAFRHLPIIAMTAHALKGDREKSLAAGMNDHINKPVNVTEVYQKVIRWLDMKPKKDVQEPVVESAQVDEVNPKEWSFLTTIPLLDLEQVLLRLDGNKKLITKMIYRYYTNQIALEQQLMAKINTGDESVAIDLHSFKSINQSIGFTSAADICIKLEEEFKVTKSFDMPLVQELHRNFVELINVLENVNWQDSTLGVAKNQQSVKQALKKVIRLLESQDTQAVDELEVLIELESDYHVLIKECYALASVYQFDKALTVLTKGFKE